MSWRLTGRSTALTAARFPLATAPPKIPRSARRESSTAGKTPHRGQRGFDVKEGQVIILDSGTTTTAIARALRSFQNLTVITNALNIAAELAGTAVK